MYHMTVFDADGNKVVDQSIAAESDKEAKTKGMKWLQDNERLDDPYRIFHTTGRLIAFHSHHAKRV